MPAEQEDIAILIEGCKKNNRKAQEQLYSRFYDAMAKLCLRYTKNEQDALEVLNNGFLKVFKNIQQFDAAKASLYTWIRTIVIRSAIDFTRAQKLRYITTPLTEKEEPPIENETIQKIKAEALLSLIRSLPVATQLVFNLYVVEGYNHKEIGELLGISEGTSRWHLSEGRKMLKQTIQLQQVNT
jgi:RNA polymerase sigma factor (sigma-70 family)